MNIAYLTQSFPPMVSGAALIAENLAKEMSARGHKVLVIAASEREHDYMTIENGLTVLRLPSIHNPMRVGQRFLLYPRRTILRSLGAFQPDVLHSHEPLQMGLLGLEYARRAGIPVLLSIHQLPWFVGAYLPQTLGMRRAAELSLWFYARWLLRQFTTLITPTQTVADIIHTMTGIEPQTISYGIDLQAFHPPLSLDEKTATRTQLNLPLTAPVILHVGRLDTDKGVERVILAAERCMQETDAHLLVVGDGRQKSALIELCVSKGTSSRCHFTGFVSVKQGLPEIYRSADLFVTASEIETQGIVLLEAAACGLPIVAVRATCIPEIVHDGVNGYLAKPGDTNALGQAMITLLRQPQKAGIMGKESRRLTGKHSILTTLDRYEQLYSDLLMTRELPQSRTQNYWERAREWMKL